jgi:hypothetical protein
MDYTTSANHDIAANGQRKHTSATSPTTRVTANDLNSLTWELLEVIKAANLTPIAFDAADVASYSQLLLAINNLIADGNAANTIIAPYTTNPTAPNGATLFDQTNRNTYLRIGGAWVRTSLTAGVVQHYYGNGIPAGWLALDPILLHNQSDYPELAATFGVTSGTFSLVDGRGRVLRALNTSGAGLDAGRTNRSLQGDQNLAHSHGGATAPGGSHSHNAWTDTVGNHSHSSGFNTGFNSGTSVGVNGAEATQAGPGSPPQTGGAGQHAHNVGIGLSVEHAHAIYPEGGAEARMANLALTLIVKI